MSEWSSTPPAESEWSTSPPPNDDSGVGRSTSSGIKTPVANPSESEGLSLMDSFVSLGESALGTGQAAVNLATFLPRALVGTLYGAGKAALAKRASEYAPGFEKVMEATAVPVNEYGQSVDEVLALPGEALKWVGEKTFERTGSPARATAAEVGPMAVLAVLGLRGGKKVVETSKGKPIKPSEMPPEQWSSTKPTVEVVQGQAVLTGWRDTPPPTAATVAPVVRPAAVAPVVAAQEQVPVVQPKQPSPPAPVVTPMAAEEVAAAVRTEAPKAGPINLKQFDTDEAVSGLIETTIGKMDPAQIQAAKRGTISFEQAQTMADATGYGAEFFLKNKRGTAYNAEQIQRFKDVVDSSTTEIAALAKKALETKSPEDLLAFKKSQLVHSALINRFVGASSEAGRTLNQLKAMSKSMDQAKFLETAIARIGKEGSVEDLAAVMAKAAEEGTLKQVLAKGGEFAWSDVFFEAWKAGLLSGVKTQVKNLVSNTSSNLLTIPERALSATIGTMRSAVTGSKDKVTFKEVQGMAEGYADIPSALRNFGEALKKEDYLLEGGGKADIFEKAITAENFRRGGFNVPVGSKAEAFIDNAGKVVRIPFRVLNATDVGFKSVAAHQQLRALAYRDAVNKGLKGDEFNNYVTQRLNNPSKAEMEAAMDWAHYVTFTKELGKFGKSLQGAAHNHPLAHLLFPFINTPVNLAKYFVERTPLQLMSKKTRRAIMNGGAEADMALGKMAAGTAMIWGLGELVENEVISMPYSIDKGQAGVEYAAGYRPFAIKTDDGYIPIDTIDPVGSMVVTAASLVALSKFSEGEMKNLPLQEQTRKLFAYSVDTFNNVFIDKTYMSGFADALDAANSKQGFDKWAQSMARSTVPTILRDVNSTIDPLRYSPRTTPEEVTGNVFLDSARGTARGAREAVAAADPLADKTGLRFKLDMWGEPAEVKTASMVNPFKPSPLVDDPLTLLRLKYGIKVPRPESETAKLGIDLSEEDQYKWQYLQGQYARKLMTNAYENADIFQMQGTDPKLDLAKATVLSDLNAAAARLATQMIGLEATLRQKDKINEELNKKLFPKPKRPDIVN